MVDPCDNIQPTKPDIPRYSIVEQFLSAKNGCNETCEDAIYTGPFFVAIIDGATSKTDSRWNGKTGGRIAAETLKEAFDHIPADTTAKLSTS